MEERSTDVVCRRCGSMPVRVVLGANNYLSDNDKRGIETGQVILGGERQPNVPSSVCLRCEPVWAEVHRLAWQDYEWQMAKERAIEAGDFLTAAQCRDRQSEVRGPLQTLVAGLANAASIDGA